ncbi:unnamed protein product [Leuciscus chuanchicus]
MSLGEGLALDLQHERTECVGERRSCQERMGGIISVEEKKRSYCAINEATTTLFLSVSPGKRPYLISENGACRDKCNTFQTQHCYQSQPVQKGTKRLQKWFSDVRCHATVLDKSAKLVRKLKSRTAIDCNARGARAKRNETSPKTTFLIIVKMQKWRERDLP